MIEHKEYEPPPLNQKKAKRILALVAAYICASVIAGAIFGCFTLPSSFNLDTSMLEGFFSSAFVSILIGLIVCVFALIPSIFVIIIAERKGWHRLSTHVFFGALIGVLCLGLITWPDIAMTWPDIAQIPYYLFLMVAVSGGVGGAIYWFMAGRKPGPFEKPGNGDML